MGLNETTSHPAKFLTLPLIPYFMIIHTYTIISVEVYTVCILAEMFNGKKNSGIFFSSSHVYF